MRIERVQHAEHAAGIRTAAPQPGSNGNPLFNGDMETGWEASLLGVRRGGAKRQVLLRRPKSPGRHPFAAAFHGASGRQYTNGHGVRERDATVQRLELVISAVIALENPK